MQFPRPLHPLLQRAKMIKSIVIIKSCKPMYLYTIKNSTICIFVSRTYVDSLVLHGQYSRFFYIPHNNATPRHDEYWREIHLYKYYFHFALVINHFHIALVINPLDFDAIIYKIYDIFKINSDTLKMTDYRLLLNITFNEKNPLDWNPQVTLYQ